MKGKAKKGGIQDGPEQGSTHRKRRPIFRNLSSYSAVFNSQKYFDYKNSKVVYRKLSVFKLALSFCMKKSVCQSLLGEKKGNVRGKKFLKKNNSVTLVFGTLEYVCIN